MKRPILIFATAATLSALACGSQGSLQLPAEVQLEGLYGPTARLDLNGNVVDIRVRQPQSQIRRGGELWARVGPYIYLFSPQTEEILRRWDGVAAVRVRTFIGKDRTQVAEAMLERDTLSSFAWRHANARVAKARLEGGRNPRYLEELVRFGEDWTEHEYNPRYVNR